MFGPWKSAAPRPYTARPSTAGTRVSPAAAHASPAIPSVTSVRPATAGTREDHRSAATPAGTPARRIAAGTIVMIAPASAGASPSGRWRKYGTTNMFALMATNVSTASPSPSTRSRSRRSDRSGAGPPEACGSVSRRTRSAATAAIAGSTRKARGQPACWMIVPPTSAPAIMPSATEEWTSPRFRPERSGPLAAYAITWPDAAAAAAPRPWRARPPSSTGAFGARVTTTAPSANSARPARKSQRCDQRSPRRPAGMYAIARVARYTTMTAWPSPTSSPRSAVIAGSATPTRPTSSGPRSTPASAPASVRPERGPRRAVGSRPG